MNRIEITGVDLPTFAAEVYNLSRPQGLGFLHAVPGIATREQAAAWIHPRGSIALDLDYVQGRACKMMVFREGEKLFIPARWYDHSEHDLAELLTRCGVQRGAETT